MINDTPLNKTTISLRLRPELLERLDALAEERGKTRTDLIEEFVMSGVRPGAIRFTGPLPLLTRMLADAAREDPAQECNAVVFLSNPVQWSL